MSTWHRVAIAIFAQALVWAAVSGHATIAGLCAYFFVMAASLAIVPDRKL